MGGVDRQQVAHSSHDGLPRFQHGVWLSHDRWHRDALRSLCVAGTVGHALVCADSGPGPVIPESKNLAVKFQTTKREPEFPVRFFADCRVGWSIPDEFLWYKAMGVGADRFVPIYHSVSGPIEIEPEQRPQEYYGRVEGRVDYKTPRLSNERLRAETAAYLEVVEKNSQASVHLHRAAGWLGFARQRGCCCGMGQVQGARTIRTLQRLCVGLQYGCPQSHDEKVSGQEVHRLCLRHHQQDPSHLKKVPTIS